MSPPAKKTSKVLAAIREKHPGKIIREASGLPEVFAACAKQPIIVYCRWQEAQISLESVLHVRNKP